LTRTSAIAVAALLAAGSTAVRAQVSPGPLSAAHHKLDGALDCVECHGGGNRPMETRCVDCHTEIGWLAQRQRGFHGQPGREKCADCHTEHRGRDHRLVAYPNDDPGQFDHQETGWPLQEKHATLKCEQCHKAVFQVSESIRLSPRAEPQESFIGLEPECSACHTDVHRGRLGEDCNGCHRPAGWRETPRFDHARTGYPLTGKHAEVKCEKCHRERANETGAARTAVFEPLAHAECSACHEDVHRSRLGPSCSRCHVTKSFRAVDRESFAHDRTGYPLEGRHARVACEKCHGGAGRETVRRPRHERCADCHAEGHGRQLADLANHDDCASCHRVQGWKPSTFGVEQHAVLSFPLGGKHAQIECADCHRPERPRVAALSAAADLGKARVAFDLGRPRCADCHRDPHQGRFGPQGRTPVEGGCGGCHGQDRFRPSVLTVEAHGRLGFAIEGAHRSVVCEKCHKQMGRPGAADGKTLAARADPLPVRFAVEDTCASCHKSPHGDQFAHRRDGGACDRCHGSDVFRPATAFDHDRESRFPLFRSHGKVACDRCHEKRPDALGRMVAIYRPISLSCKECHRRIAPTAPGGGALRPLPARR